MFPEGTFTATINNDKWSFKCEKDKFTASRNAVVVVEGTFKVAADVVEFSDEKGPFASIGDRKSGKYRWKLDGEKLTFTRVEDKSDGRAEVLTGQTWVVPKK